MTDAVTVILSLPATATIPGIIFPTRPNLTVRCREGVLEAFITAGLVLDSDLDHESSVRVRWDDGTPAYDTWSVSSDLQAVFVDDPVEFIMDGLLKHRKLRVEVQPYDRAPQVASFSLVGLGRHMSVLRKACPFVLPEASAVEAAPAQTKGIEKSPDDEVPAEEANVVHSALPEFPLQATSSTGTVIVRFWVDEYDVVSKIRVYGSLDADLRDAALAAAKQWTFSAAKKGGKPVPSFFQTRFEFSRP